MYTGFDTRPIRDRMDDLDKRVYDQLVAERDSLDSSFVNAIRLLDDEISNLRAKATGLAPGEIVLTEKILVPVDENPGVSLSQPSYWAFLYVGQNLFNIKPGFAKEFLS